MINQWRKQGGDTFDPPDRFMGGGTFDPPDGFRGVPSTPLTDSGFRGGGRPPLRFRDKFFPKFDKIMLI